MVAGSLLEGSGGSDVQFCPDEISYLKRMFWISNRKIKGYACLLCSHLELMVEFTDKDRKKYQEFEGQQPGVRDRMSYERTRSRHRQDDPSLARERHSSVGGKYVVEHNDVALNPAVRDRFLPNDGADIR